jgi:hypothetical protein
MLETNKAVQQRPPVPDTGGRSENRLALAAEMVGIAARLGSRSEYQGQRSSISGNLKSQGRMACPK